MNTPVPGPPPGHEVVDLSAAPRLGDAYAAALREGVASALRRPANPRLSAVAVTHGPVTADAATLTAYQHLLGLPGTDELPAGYVHVLSFPVAMALMTRPDFPLPVLGLVHVANRVTQRRALAFGEALRVTAWAEALRPHRRGTLVDVQVTAAAGDAVVWAGTSTYLSRGVRREGASEAGVADAPAGTGAAAPDVAGAAEAPAVWQGRHVWRLAADTGRRFAAVSGDGNPIHTSRVGARMFGFPRPIAHGMYTAARALSEVPRQQGPFEWTADFGKPVLLPGTVVLHFAPIPGGWSYAVHARSGKTHLSGVVRALDS